MERDDLKKPQTLVKLEIGMFELNYKYHERFRSARKILAAIQTLTDYD